MGYTGDIVESAGHNAHSIVSEYHINEFKRGNPDVVRFILNEFKPYVRFMVRTNFLRGSTWEDLVQECHYGLVRGVYTYSEQKGNFHAFVKLSIRGAVANAVKGSFRLKHRVLTDAMRLDYPVGDSDSGAVIQDFVEDRSSLNPEKVMLATETYHETLGRIKAQLTSIEFDVLLMKAHGFSAKEIQESTGYSLKQIDNASRRARGKLEKLGLEKLTG